MTSLRKAVENYLEMRRALGFKLRFQGAALNQFVAFLEKEKGPLYHRGLGSTLGKAIPRCQSSPVG